MEIDLVSMPSRLFKPADGYETADASATLVLRNLGEGVTLLSPHRLATMGREDVERMISSYASQLEICIARTAETHPENLIKLQKRIIRLVNEVSAFISVVEAQQPLGSKTWTDDDSDNCPKGCASWSQFLDELQLSQEQMNAVTEMYTDSNQSLQARSEECTCAVEELQEAKPRGSNGRGKVATSQLLRQVMAHRALIRSLTSSLEAFFDQINQLRDVVLREVLDPLQAARVYVACSPRPPQLMPLLEEIYDRVSRGISHAAEIQSADHVFVPSDTPASSIGASSSFASAASHTSVEPKRARSWLLSEISRMQLAERARREQRTLRPWLSNQHLGGPVSSVPTGP